MEIINITDKSINMSIGIGRCSFVNDIETQRKALHEDIEIKCFYEGKATLLIGSQTVTAQAGDIVIINPYEFHATIDCGKETGKYHLFMLPLDYFSKSGLDDFNLRTLLLAQNKAFKTFFSNDKTMFRLLMEIIKEYEEKQTAYPVAIHGLMTDFLAHLLRNGMSDTNSSAKNCDTLRIYQLIEPALRQIKDNYSHTFTVEQLAKSCKLSKHYFCRLFKNVTGKTTMEYLRDYRMTVADAMLYNSNKDITQIAELCGFDDVNYFRRCYKNFYKITPNKRRSNRSLAGDQYLRLD